MSTVSVERDSGVAVPNPWPLRRFTIIFLWIALPTVMILSASLGAVSIPPLTILSILLHSVGIDISIPFTDLEYSIFYSIRLPRVILCCAAGAGLALSGGLLQGLFRNALAAPTLIGTSFGAMLAVVFVIVVGHKLFEAMSDSVRLLVLPMSGFTGGLVATLLVYRIARNGGRTSVSTMLLAGIGINALALAFTGYLIFLADDAQLRNITFWNLGSVGGATWKDVLICVIPTSIAIGLALPLLKSLNVMLLGESEAMFLGINTDAVKRLAIIACALAVGGAVAVTGNVQFVGLVVPNLLRLILGSDHRILIPSSILLGASLLPASDLIARTIVIPEELPLGVVTAFLGAPFFLWLLVRHRKGFAS